MPEKQNIPITHWDEKDKPREKLLAQGRSSLSDAELLAIIMGSGNTEKSAVELAREIMDSVNNSIDDLSGLSVADLMRFKGVGNAKAIAIVAAMELGRRRRFETKNRVQIRSSKDVFQYMFPVFDKKPYEEFWIVLLNRANKIISRERISSGSLTGSLADPKKVFKIAVDRFAASIILVHNHPSGNLKPSQSDITLTKKLKSAGETLDIAVLDHLIIGEDDYYSFADETIM